ncbi:MAG: L-threonylcarbamoyladenylate synthase [Cyclobacteriaceae bacterium]|nr:L-threonylcarbamoyladenylate synthase [Cyclobacteriaceae bacterium]
MDIGGDIHYAADLLKKGEVVAIPTETVYGLAANAHDSMAVTHIFKIKERPFFDPLIVHTWSIETAARYVLDFPDVAMKLARAFWPGPLTLILPKKDLIPDIVTSGLDTVGLRIPDHPLTLALLKLTDLPLAAPSANPFGYVSPTTPRHVADQLSGKIDYILDGGPCRVGLESTIVGFEEDIPIVYRLGGITVEKIEKVIGKVVIRSHSTSNPKAPGMLKSHYAPKVPLLFGDISELLPQHSGKKVALLTFREMSGLAGVKNIALSPAGNLEEAAQNLFRVLRSFDHADIDLVLAAPFPDHGLGRAINDKLRRAAAL